MNKILITADACRFENHKSLVHKEFLKMGRFERNEPTLADGLADALKVLGSFAGPICKEKLGNDELDGFAVSTIDSTDCGFETAICDENGAHPVERYDNREAALAGHQRWIDFIRSGSRSVLQLGYGTENIVKPVPITLLGSQDKG